MTVYTDGKHLMARREDGTTNYLELHDFAKRLGLKPEWYQNHPRHPHYDLTTGRMARKAVALGAKVVSPRFLVGQGEVMPSFLVVEPDPVSDMLGTGYMRFESGCGVFGLAKAKGDRLDVLAVVASMPGTGQFREFVRRAKLEYRTICVWEDWNPLVGEILNRYGFRRVTEVQDDGELLTGWRWGGERCPAV
jgi:hypothetical protein